ncbi:MAG: AtpZ/AtpI family protein [Ignavibacterium sp.]|nr:MAG: AtpZ/AtpI family protein [Ignavibacterium sp.]
MSTEPDKLKNINRIYRTVGPYIGLGMQLAVTVIVMIFLGIWLDGIFNLDPVLTITFAFLGVFAGLYNFIKSVIKSDK